MLITPQQLIDTIEQKNGFPLDKEQKLAIKHGTGPLWIIAGPGTGKTEVIVVRCLKLICCDNVYPGSIMVTTFTEKASRNLEDRVLEAMLYISNQHPHLLDIDISRLRIGTLHSLCNDILQEYKYVPYQNLRLLDDIETKMLIRDKVAKEVRDQQRLLQSNFDYIFNRPYPNLWTWTNSLKTLFDRIIDYMIDIDALRKAGGHWKELAEAYDIYVNKLNKSYKCDFAHLQKYFLDFLNTPRGEFFLKGDGTSQHPPLLNVLVDEYQDTNPIQEEIYFTLARNAPHNLTVVGDDDQALYRFRGGTVECMVGFNDQCQNKWGVSSNQIALVNNYRSNSGIVKWCNDYINSFKLMSQNQARVQGKPPISSASERTGNHPNVGLIREGRVRDVATSFATAVQGLLDNGIIEDYSQCVLLLRSTKDSRNYATPYIEALRQQGIPIYNPRSRAFLDQPEVQELLGAFVSIIDTELEGADERYLHDVIQMVRIWLQAYDNIAQSNPLLRKYVERSQEAISNLPVNERITPGTSTILYRILSHEPFITYQSDPEQDLRLSKVTRLFEVFCSHVGRSLHTDSNHEGRINGWWLYEFYHIFCGYLQNQGIDDDEDEEVICPLGRLPIMTIHQSKGLEFDFVFVGTLGSSISVRSEHELESNLRRFRQNASIIIHSPEDAVWHDTIRLHYVAYSRAKHALILLASNSQLRKSGTETASFGGYGGQWIKQNIQRL